MFAPTGLVPFLGEGSILRKARAGSLHRVVAAVPFDGSRGKNVRYTVEGFGDTMTHSHLEIQVRMGVVGVEMPIVLEQGPTEPSDLIRNHQAVRANLALVESPIVDGAAGKKADLELAKWQELALDPKNVAVERDGEVSIAHVGREPENYRDWLVKARSKELGCGGKGWVLVDLFGEGAITHNLSDVRSVPPAYAHLFRITHIRVERMTDRQERAHWDRFEPVAEGDAKRAA